jgi:hypothetical protein
MGPNVEVGDKVNYCGVTALVVKVHTTRTGRKLAYMEGRKTPVDTYDLRIIAKKEAPHG